MATTTGEPDSPTEWLCPDTGRLMTFSDGGASYQLLLDGVGLVHCSDLWSVTSFARRGHHHERTWSVLRPMFGPTVREWRNSLLVLRSEVTEDHLEGSHRWWLVPEQLGLHPVRLFPSCSESFVKQMLLEGLVPAVEVHGLPTEPESGEESGRFHTRLKVCASSDVPAVVVEHARAALDQTRANLELVGGRLSGGTLGYAKGTSSSDYGYEEPYDGGFLDIGSIDVPVWRLAMEAELGAVRAAVVVEVTGTGEMDGNLHWSVPDRLASVLGGTIPLWLVPDADTDPWSDAIVRRHPGVGLAAFELKPSPKEDPREPGTEDVSALEL